VKDLIDMAGLPTTAGSRAIADGALPAERDAACLAGLRSAIADGRARFAGKVNLHELAYGITGINAAFGTPVNPLDPRRMPGGSSSGSGTAIASGEADIAYGSDTGGSIRIPAACCGLVGLKPARGRVSVGPDAGESFLVGDGVLTRTVVDTAAALDVLAGPELGDSSWAPPPERPYTESAVTAPGRLKIGLAFNAPLAGAELDPVCEQAARDAATQLESLGHQVQEITPPWSSPELLPYFSRLFGPAVSMTTWIGGRLAGRDPIEEDVEPLTWEIWERARDQDTITYLMAENRLQSVGRSLVQVLAPFDVVITPALAQRPLRTGEVHGRGPDPWDHFRRSGLFTPYTAICNVIGLPAISLPLYQGDDGLPAAVQVIGRPAAEDVLLSLAGQLEAALPWAGRRPDAIGV
jgi:amidase